MNKKSYDRMLSSIGKEVKQVINEQFNIGNMDFNNIKQKPNKNIFNKKPIDVNEIYNKILKNQATDEEIRLLNDMPSVIKSKDKAELVKVIKFYSENYSEDSLNWLDVSGITDMSELFKETNYNGDISEWNTSNVTNMSWMFYYAESFNQPIGDWDVSNVTEMFGMFKYAKVFNQHIGNWDVSKVTDMEGMFRGAISFN